MNFRNGGMFILLFLSTLTGSIQARDPAPFPEIFKKGYVEVKGKSEGKQSRFQAWRAAEVMAQRELLRVLQKIRIYGSKEIGGGSPAADVEGFLKGSVTCGSVYDEERGQAEVCLRLNLYGPQGLYDYILPWLKQNRIVPEYHLVYAAEPTPAIALPDSIPDGVIFDVRALPFQPALLNRILTSQDTLVFDPLRIDSEFLIAYGCGAYSADLPAARNLLLQRGSRNPLVLFVQELDRQTDVKVSPEQAGFLMASEKAFQVLSQAKIVFWVQE
ncbi:MAG: hypothetical protein EHM45_14650 [Desulfobacteraceae bacterium]|nr:MAG: hypothetical protein EHM45_14650 [Desulfobacteraceae bacterium]